MDFRRNQMRPRSSAFCIEILKRGSFKFVKKTTLNKLKKEKMINYSKTVYRFAVNG